MEMSCSEKPLSNAAVPFIAGIRNLVSVYDAFIVDLWGVIYEEQHLCYGVFNALSQLNDEGKKVVFLSNSPLRSFEVAKNLERMGVKPRLYQGVLTSGEMIYHEMQAAISPFFMNLGRRCFHLGPDCYWHPFASLGYTAVRNIDEADFILASGTFGTRDEMEKYDPFLKVCLSRRLPMICVCPDPFVYQNGVLHVAAGALAAQYQKNGGNVFWRGKPDPAVFEYCLEGMDVPDRRRVAVIGDSLMTDIKGANLSGLDALFVAGGFHAKELGVTRGQQPDAESLSALLVQNDCSVRGILPAFVW